MTKRIKQLREENGDHLKKMKAIVNAAEKEARLMSEEEKTSYDDLSGKIEANKEEVERLEKQFSLEQELEGFNPGNTVIEVSNKQYESNTAMFDLTGDLFRTVMNKDLGADSRMKQAAEIQKKLMIGGHYKEFKNEADSFNTLVDRDGAVFLPTTIADQIFEISRNYGIFSGEGAMNVPLSVGGGERVYPNLLGELEFHAVAEGNDGAVSKFTFSGMKLQDRKWMTYVPWTNEAAGLMGERLVSLIVRKLGEAAAKSKDDTGLNGDGTSKYHNIKGIITRASDASHPEVRMSTAAATHTSFGAIDEKDFNQAQLDIAPSLRSGGFYILHTDWEVRLREIVDGENRPLYLTGGAISFREGRWFIWNRPVLFSDKAPNEDGVSKVYGVFYNPNYLAFGEVPAMSADRFDTGTLPAKEGGTINLLSQDKAAIRAKIFYDLELSQATVESSSTTLGAFTVLRTAAS